MKTPVLLYFLRHGHTGYAKNHPDLTDVGVREMEDIAQAIRARVGGVNDKVFNFVSSPQPRAFGSTKIIRDLFDGCCEIKIEQALRCMDFYDPAMAELPWTQYGGEAQNLHAYMTDNSFESGERVEKRSSVQRRFFGYLNSLCERFVDGDLPDVMVHVSHFEVLYRLAHQILPAPYQPFTHGDVIEIKLTPYEVGPDFGVTMCVIRAGKEHGLTKQFHCQIAPTLFGQQFLKPH